MAAVSSRGNDMPINRINAAQFADDITAGILTRDDNYDVTEEVSDLAIVPQARVFERQHEDIRKLSAIITLQNTQEFTADFELDVLGIVSNEGLTLQLGSQSVGVAVFARTSPPSADLPVQRGYPIGTLPDESTGSTLVFVTSESRTMFASSASSYFNTTTRRYELSVPVIAVVVGADGRVAANRIRRALRPLVGFESVTNPSPTVGGRDQETVDEIVVRYFLAIIGRRLATTPGLEKYVRDEFAEVNDVLVVSGTNPLLTRAGDDAGAVDVYLIGDESIEVVESPNFYGAGQIIRVMLPPIESVLSVQDLSTGTTFVEGTDYDVVQDVTGVAASSRAVDGIRFRFTGALPSIGSPVSITYTYNNLVRRLQAAIASDDTLVHGRDALMKAATEVSIIHSANLRVKSGYNSTLVTNAVRAAVLALINTTLRLAGTVEGSDIQGVVRQISGVDNYIITRLTRSTIPSGVADVPIADNEYPSLAVADFATPLI